MSVVNSYNQNSKVYQNLINKFMDKFELYFSNSDVKRDDIKRLFLENLKSIKLHENEVSFKKIIVGRLSGVYNRLTKELEYTENDESTIYHEMFHALSRKAVLKREKYLNFFASTILGQKQLSVREFEEGMTEYLNSCICGEVAKNVRFSYSQVTTIVNKLAKIYGDEIILEYYLGFNTNLIDEMNKDQPNSFKNVVQLCQKVDSNGEQPVAFEASKYYKKNGDVVFDDLLFNLFSKKKLKKVTSIEDFKYNVKQLFSFYESDLYKICFDIDNAEQEIQKLNDSANADQNTIGFYQYAIESNAKLLANFNNILMTQWEKLNLKDTKLFYNLVLDEILQFNAYASPIILDYLDYWDKQIELVYQERNKDKNNYYEEAKEGNKVMVDSSNSENNYLGNLSKSDTIKSEFNYIGTKVDRDKNFQINDNRFLGDIEKQVVSKEDNSYLGNIESLTTKTSNSYLGDADTKTDDSQAMEYVPVDLDKMSKDQLESLKDKLVQDYSDENKQGYSR